MVRKKLYRDTNLKIIFCITLMSIQGVSIISPAFPKIASELNILTKDIGLLITVFTFPDFLLLYQE